MKPMNPRHYTHLLFFPLLLLLVFPLRAQDARDVLYPGVYQAEDVVERSGFSWVVAVDGAEGADALEAEDVTFSAYGTDIYLRVGRGFMLTTPAISDDVSAVLTSSLEQDAYADLCASVSGNCSPATLAPPGDEQGWVTVRIAHSPLPTT